MGPTSGSTSVEAGQVVAGKYRLEKPLGKGGMGAVWRAHHLELGSPVALKILKPEVGKSANSRARFLREAKAAAMLRSPHVVQIFEHGSDGELIYIAMEMLEGETLLSRLKREQRLTPELVVTILTHVGRAMTKAHELGIVHRDLKPENIFLVHNDDEIVAKVLDFGIAKSSIMKLGSSTHEGPYTQTGALLGTPYYMSPEQATGEKGIDHRADLWAMGVIAFECLLGRRPYQSDSLGDLVLQICSKPQPVPSQLATLPADFDAWFLRAQKRDPAERFQSARELTRALRQALTGVRASLDQASTTGPDASNSYDRSSQEVDVSAGATVPSHPPALALTPQVATDRGFPPRADAAAASGEPAETLDAFTATTHARRRPWLLGVVALGVVLAAAVGGWQFARTPTGEETGEQAAPGQEAPSAQPSDEPSSEEAPSDEAPSDAANALDGPDAGDSAAAASASASASATSPAPALRPPRPPPRPRAPPPPRRPPPPTDPLAI